MCTFLDLAKGSREDEETDGTLLDTQGTQPALLSEKNMRFPRDKLLGNSAVKPTPIPPHGMLLTGNPRLATNTKPLASRYVRFARAAKKGLPFVFNEKLDMPHFLRNLTN